MNGVDEAVVFDGVTQRHLFIVRVPISTAQLKQRCAAVLGESRLFRFVGRVLLEVEEEEIEESCVMFCFQSVVWQVSQLGLANGNFSVSEARKTLAASVERFRSLPMPRGLFLSFSGGGGVGGLSFAARSLFALGWFRNLPEIRVGVGSGWGAVAMILLSLDLGHALLDLFSLWVLKKNIRSLTAKLGHLLKYIVLKFRFEWIVPLAATAEDEEENDELEEVVIHSSSIRDRQELLQILVACTVSERKTGGVRATLNGCAMQLRSGIFVRPNPVFLLSSLVSRHISSQVVSFGVGCMARNPSCLLERLAVRDDRVTSQFKLECVGAACFTFNRPYVPKSFLTFFDGSDKSSDWRMGNDVDCNLKDRLFKVSILRATILNAIDDGDDRRWEMVDLPPDLNNGAAHMNVWTHDDPFIVACQNGDIDVVRKGLHGIAPKKMDGRRYHGLSAVEVAVRARQLSVMKLFLSSMTRKRIVGAFLGAAGNNDVKLFSELEELYGIPEKYVWHILKRACEFGRDNVVRQMLDRFDYLTQEVDSDGTSLLHMACQSGNLAVVVLLLEHGADINAQTSNRETPLMWAARRGVVEITSYLLENDAVASTLSSSSESALHIACRGTSVEVVALLCEFGAVVDEPDSEGWTPLAIACRSGALKMVEMLVLNYDAYIPCNGNATSRDPLTIACSSGRQEILDVLIENAEKFNIGSLFDCALLEGMFEIAFGLLLRLKMQVPIMKDAAQACVFRKEYAEAVYIYNECLDIEGFDDPAYVVTLSQKAIALAKLDRGTELEKLFKKYSSLIGSVSNGEIVEAWKNFGRAFEDLGMLRQAHSAYRACFAMQINLFDPNGRECSESQGDIRRVEHAMRKSRK